MASDPVQCVQIQIRLANTHHKSLTLRKSGVLEPSKSS